MPLHYAAIGTFRPDFLTPLGNCVLLSLLVLSCSMGPQVLKANQPISLQELETLCDLPLPCGTPMACEGRTVTMWGYVDPANIFSKQRILRAPYEKFRLIDHQRRSIEVWSQADDSRPIFEKLAQRPSDKIVVTGRLKAVKMPTMGSCLKGIKALINDESQIQFR